MTSSPLFSVIIPTYNRASFIRKTVESVTAQKFDDFEIIIIDDGSTDNTEEVLSGITDSRIHYIKTVNAERGAARNAGVKKAVGAYMTFLDSDDLLYPNHLSTAFSFIQTNKEAVIFHLAYAIHDQMNGTSQRMPVIKNINKQIIDGNMLSCSGIFIKKQAIVDNPFNEDRDMASLEDWELWIRMSARYPFFYVNEVTSALVLHADRSVISDNSNKLKVKADRFLKCIAADEVNQKVYGMLLTRTVSSLYMYTALHLAMANGSLWDVVSYLKKGIVSNRGSLFTKRFLVILKILAFRK